MESDQNRTRDPAKDCKKRTDSEQNSNGYAIVICHRPDKVCEAKKAIYSSKANVQCKDRVVLSSYTVVEPHAVMIEALDACPAYSAVDCIFRPEELAG